MSHFDENSFILRENIEILWGLQIISVLELWLACTALSLSSTYLTRFIKFPFGVLELCPGQKSGGEQTDGPITTCIPLLANKTHCLSLFKR